HEAIARYERSLDAYRDCGDDHGCALAYHNLGMGSADRGWLNAADCYFRESRALAERVGDAYLRGLCLVNHAEVDVTRQRFEDARQKAEEALAVFDQLGAQSAKAEAYRVIGMVYRETGRIVLAASRLRSAIELAATAGAVLGEADGWRQSATVHELMASHQGELRMPHELLRKPGPLTREERQVVQMHPIWGIELLASVEFPWDLKPIIRWHHERYDGTGYPDHLKGDEIPLAAQIVGMLDVYDAL